VSIALLRVDERLIHGQVTVGWGMRLKPSRYVVVDDQVADAEWEQELMALGAPEGVDVEFHSVEAARALLERWQSRAERMVLLTRDVGSMLRLAREGRLEGREVNLGGIHDAPGRVQVLPYLFLGDDERAQIRELVREGVQVTAQDLPGSRRRPAVELLS
jgi:mannose/fructose/N-acetylgalactosamine-specific phosphotransferase system component IIB